MEVGPTEQIAVSVTSPLLITGGRCHPGSAPAGMKQPELSRCFCGFRRRQERKQNEPRSLFRDERTSCFALFAPRFCSAARLSCHILCLPDIFTLIALQVPFEYLSLCFTRRLPSPGTGAVQMTAALHVNMKVYVRSLQILSDLCICWRIM